MELKRSLKLIDVFCISTGAMVSSGLFILPGLAFSITGPAVAVAYLLAGLFSLAGMLSIAELATAMPKAGGDYFFITRALGPAVGTISGLLSWFSLSLKSAFALIGMAAFAQLILPGYDMQLIAVILCAIFIVLNILGVKQAARFQVTLVLVMLVLMVLYIVLGLPKIQLENFQPFSTAGWEGIFQTAGFVFVSYGGLLYISSIAEEVDNPNKIIPLALILSLTVVCIFYVLMVFVTTGVLPASDFSGSLTPISDGAAIFMGDWGMIALSIAAILAFVSTANGGLLSASRYPMSLSRDRLMPKFLGRISDKYNTPYLSIIITGTFVVIFLLLELEVLVKAASTVVILTNILACLTLIILHESKLQNYQPKFTSPLYPWLQIIGILGFIFLLFEMGLSSYIITAFLILIGFFAFWFYGRIESDREYALLYLVERITSKDITSYTLETELKEIIRERDNISRDQFDEIIEECPILDLEGPLKMEEFLDVVSDRLEQELHCNKKEIYNALLKRENEYSTVISEHLAIPHIIISGENIFTILLARCKQGVEFPESDSLINTIFVIAGSKDKRTFHLRTLAAIAQIVNDPTFENRWMSANNEKALRDTILLANRNRNKYFATK